MAKVAVREQILRWAMERAHLTAEGLRGKFPKIDLWMQGADKPTMNQLEALASATRTPLGFFFLEEPLTEPLPIPHFRTLGPAQDPNPSPELLDTVYAMQQRQEWMHEYMVKKGMQPLSFVGTSTVEASPETVATRIRRILGLQEGWANELPTWTAALTRIREATENAGILVVVNGIVGNNTSRVLDPSEFRGFVLVDSHAPLVFVNNTDGKAAQMFTHAHELAHIMLGSSAAFDLRQLQAASDDTEKACDRIAAEFLVPGEKLRQLWPQIRNHAEPFQSAARTFKVSSLVAARRALDLRLIRRDEFFQFYEAYERDERRKVDRLDGGGDFYANQDYRIGRKFASTVIRAAKEGDLLYSDAFNLTGLHGATFDNYARTLGIGNA